MNAAEFVDGLDPDTPPATTPEPPPYVELKGGLTVPIKALELALALERRGFRLRVEKDDLKVGSGRGTLTDEDRENLKTYRAHIIAIVAYKAPGTP